MISAERAETARRLAAMINAGWMAQATYAAAELGIADALLAGPKTCTQLASESGADAAALCRLLRALASLGLVREEGERFAVTPLGMPLAARADPSLKSWALTWGRHHWFLWSRLVDSVRTGISARRLLGGTEGFEHLERDAEHAALFNDAMAQLTRLVAPDVVRAYDFADLRVVDVGGGKGELLAAVLAAYPTATGVLLDRPHALDAAAANLAALGLAARCELVAGDFFEAVPRGGDLYLLKSVIHDWDDERSERILTVCAAAMSPSSRVLLVERIMPERMQLTPEHQSAAWSDLNMLVALAAKERTAAELDSLLRSAGLQRTGVWPAGPAFSVIEARPG